MNYTTKKHSKEVSSSKKQSFHLIREKEGLLSQEDKATCRGHDLSACEGLHRDILQDLGESSGPGSSQGIPGGIQGDKPLGYGDGLCIRIFLLETKIQNLIEVGDREALRKALREYFLAWVRLERGEP